MNERGGPHFAVLQKSLFQTTCHKTYFVTSSHINTHLLSLSHTHSLFLSLYMRVLMPHTPVVQSYSHRAHLSFHRLSSLTHTHIIPVSFAHSQIVAHTKPIFSLSLSLSFLDYDILTNELSGELAACQTSFGVG